MPSNLNDLIAGARSAKRAHRDVEVSLDAAVAEQIEALDGRILALEQEQIDVSQRADVDLGEAKTNARLADPRIGEIEEARDTRIAVLTEQIEKATVERDALADGTTVMIRFTQLPGQAWAAICARNPARADVLIDRLYNYNYHDAAKQAAVYRDPVEEGGRVYAELVTPGEGDAEPALEPITVEQWEGIFEVIHGHEFERVASVIWDLNDYGPRQRIASAGKVSRASSAAR
jgi:hypothetical protein